MQLQTTVPVQQIRQEVARQLRNQQQQVLQEEAAIHQVTASHVPTQKQATTAHVAPAVQLLIRVLRPEVQQSRTQYRQVLQVVQPTEGVPVHQKHTNLQLQVVVQVPQIATAEAAPAVIQVEAAPEVIPAEVAPASQVEAVPEAIQAEAAVHAAIPEEVVPEVPAQAAHQETGDKRVYFSS